jgi:hypothetical protein
VHLSVHAGLIGLVTVFPVVLECILGLPGGFVDFFLGNDLCCHLPAQFGPHLMGL